MPLFGQSHNTRGLEREQRVRVVDIRDVHNEAAHHCIEAIGHAEFLRRSGADFPVTAPRVDGIEFALQHSRGAPLLQRHCERHFWCKNRDDNPFRLTQEVSALRFVWRRYVNMNDRVDANSECKYTSPYQTRG